MTMARLAANPQPGDLSNGHANPLQASTAQLEEEYTRGHSNASIFTSTQPETLTNGHDKTSTPIRTPPEGITNGHSNRKDNLRVVPTAIDEIAQRTPNTVFASIPKTSDPVDGYRDVTYREYADTIDRAASLLEESIRGLDHGEAIGYIGPSDLRYVILAIAAVKIDMKV